MLPIKLCLKSWKAADELMSSSFADHSSCQQKNVCVCKTCCFKMCFDNSPLFLLPSRGSNTVLSLSPLPCVFSFFLFTGLRASVCNSSVYSVFWQYPAVLVSPCGLDKVSSLFLCCVFFEVWPVCLCVCLQLPAV